MKIYTDGASRGNPGPASAGIVVGDHKFGVCLGFATNNVAEYRALVYALNDAITQGAKEIEIFSDSLLLVKQVQGEWNTGELLQIYLFDIRYYLRYYFDRWTITHIPRGENAEADRLANEALDKNCKK